MNVDETIYNLEVKLAHLEDYTKELNAVIIEQSNTIASLQTQLNALKDKLSKEGENEITNEKPPHY